MCAVQLLHKMRIRAAEASETLLRVIRNPVTVHLPVGAKIIGEYGFPLFEPYYKTAGATAIVGARARC